LKLSRYSRNAKALGPYLSQWNGHVTYSTSSSTTTNIAIKACSKTWRDMVWSCLIWLDELEIHTITTPVCCHLFVMGGLHTLMTRIAMPAWVFILLLRSPKPDRLKD